MPANRFHLAWFLQGSSIQAWGEPWTGNISEEWMAPSLFIDLVRSMERACFDYILIEDSIYVGQNWKNSRDIFLKNGMSVPRQEPSVVATLMAAATTRLGIVPTLSTFAYAPYLTARIVGTLDQISSGRGGWNMVTGSSDLSAQNFGMEKLPEHDQRYDMAEEYIEICKRLWTSWEPGAIVADRKSGVLIDPAKVHTIDFTETSRHEQAAAISYSVARVRGSGPNRQHARGRGGALGQPLGHLASPADAAGATGHQAHPGQGTRHRADASGRDVSGRSRTLLRDHRPGDGRPVDGGGPHAENLVQARPCLSQAHAAPARARGSAPGARDRAAPDGRPSGAGHR
jgi:alkanesulfonate monooxygenase SsuD/methylene tetrahydromethanopterin reductase-like flavin-dependent oxidoreductase (luciferase family)